MQGFVEVMVCKGVQGRVGQGNVVVDLMIQLSVVQRSDGQEAGVTFSVTMGHPEEVVGVVVGVVVGLVMYDAHGGWTVVVMVKHVVRQVQSEPLGLAVTVGMFGQLKFGQGSVVVTPTAQAGSTQPNGMEQVVGSTYGLVTVGQPVDDVVKVEDGGGIGAPVVMIVVVMIVMIVVGGKLGQGWKGIVGLTMIGGMTLKEDVEPLDVSTGDAEVSERNEERRKRTLLFLENIMEREALLSH